MGLMKVGYILQLMIMECIFHLIHLQVRGEYFVIAYANNAFQKLPAVINRLIDIKRENIQKSV